MSDRLNSLALIAEERELSHELSRNPSKVMLTSLLWVRESGEWICCSSFSSPQSYTLSDVVVKSED